LHLGNVRAAVFNWLFSRKLGGAFVVRIEDTDTDRNVAGGEDDILEDLFWPDIGGANGPYRQSGRDGLYDEAVARLLAGGRAPPEHPEAGAALRCHGPGPPVLRPPAHCVGG
jgi:glutamyl/glutaminyl-tRNA synthetase